MSDSNARPGRRVELDWLCRACRAGGHPLTSAWRDLHELCDPVTYFCACPCDTGELTPERHP